MRFIPAVFALVVCGLQSCAAAPNDLAASFPLGVYWPWERVQPMADRAGLDKWVYVERSLDDMRAHNVDSVWAVNLGIPDLAPLAARMAARGMKLVPALGELHYNVEWRRNNWEYLEQESRRAIAAAGESPAILAWALCDEPTRPIVAEMEKFRQRFHEWGAKQPAVVVTMWPDTPTYSAQTDFAAACTDIYPFFTDGNPNGPNPAPVSRNWYRNNATICAQVAYTNGQTPWVMPQAYDEVWGPWKWDAKGNAVVLPGGIVHWRPPTPAEMKWQVWCAVAAGVRGFFWFCYSPDPGDMSQTKPYVGPTFPASMAAKQETPLDFPGALVHPDGSATPQYEAAAEAFGALRKLTTLLTGAAPASPLGEVAVPGFLGTLRNPQSGRTFGVLVNDDTDAAHTLKLRLAAPKPLVDLRTGARLTPDAEGCVTLTLGAGDGTVVE